MHNNTTTTQQALGINGFLGRIFLWLVPLFFFWYIAAGIVCYPAIFLADFILPYALPGIITALEPQGYLADIITTLSTKDASGRIGLMVIETNTLIYAYGLPLLMAMTLATNTSIFHKLDTLTYGILILIAVHTWGICFDVLTTLVLKMGGGVFQQIIAKVPAYSDELIRNGLALGYQLGSLILPAVVPIGFWVLRHQAFLKGISENKD